MFLLAENLIKLRSAYYFERSRDMKKYIKSTYCQIYGGIYVENKAVKFNWNEDRQGDVLSLCQDTSGEFDKMGVRYIYGYEFNEGVSGNAKRLVRDYLKKLAPGNHLFDEDVDKFAENGIFRIENYDALDSFDATVSIESTSDSFSLINVMDQFFFEYCRCRDFEFKLLKQTYEHVTFDAKKAADVLRESGWSDKDIRKEIEFTVNKFNELKQSGQLFQMKRFIPKEIRQGFINFLKFKTEAEEETYRNLQGSNVLIYDDFYTSGSTINEIIRYLHSINDKNTLTVFILVKQ